MNQTKLGTIGFMFALLLAFLPAFYKSFSTRTSWTLALSQQTLPSTPIKWDPLYEEAFVPVDPSIQFAHSATVVELKNGKLLAVWNGGSEEAATDVVLYQSYWNKQNRIWEGTRILTGVRQTERELDRYIEQIGNPVLLNEGGDRFGLLYVSAVGGWSGSALNYCYTTDEGITWSSAKRLVTSPFLNFSTMVRNAPFLYTDGSIGVPVYHAFIRCFGELLRIGPNGTVIEKVRISSNPYSLQPSVIPIDSSRAIALLRYRGFSPKRILVTVTADGGRTWGASKKLPLPNPNSAVAGLRMQDGVLLLAFNNSETARNNLSLATSLDSGRSWTVIKVLEESREIDQKEFSYPAMIQSSDGFMHLLYSWNRKRIKHVSFNSQWLTMQ